MSGATLLRTRAGSHGWGGLGATVRTQASRGASHEADGRGQQRSGQGPAQPADVHARRIGRRGFVAQPPDACARGSGERSPWGAQTLYFARQQTVVTSVGAGA